jgi:hypothetical protein
VQRGKRGRGRCASSGGAALVPGSGCCPAAADRRPPASPAGPVRHQGCSDGAPHNHVVSGGNPPGLSGCPHCWHRQSPGSTRAGCRTGRPHLEPIERVARDRDGDHLAVIWRELALPALTRSLPAVPGS